MIPDALEFAVAFFSFLLTFAAVLIARRVAQRTRTKAEALTQSEIEEVLNRVGELEALHQEYSRVVELYESLTHTIPETVSDEERQQVLEDLESKKKAAEETLQNVAELIRRNRRLLYGPEYSVSAQAHRSSAELPSTEE